MVALVIWALVWPANANSNLGSLNWSLLEGFNAFYIIIVGLFAFFLAVVAILPQTGKRKMGRAGEAPEFSNFSWFSMMFGAGLGVCKLFLCKILSFFNSSNNAPNFLIGKRCK